MALFFYNKVGEVRRKMEEERGKKENVFKSVTFSDFAYYNSREMCNFAD